MSDEKEAAAISDFREVPVSALIVAVMSDGRWYTLTKLRHRIGFGLYKGLASRLVSRLRREGYLLRAENPLWDGLHNGQGKMARYVYRWTGVEWYGLTRLLNLRQNRPGPYECYRTSRGILNTLKNDI